MPICRLKEDPTLNPVAGACVTCPRRSGANTSLFCDVQGDQCLDAPCFQAKVNAHIDREVAAQPELVQIENGYRSPKQQRPGAVQEGFYREIETVVENPDAEPVPPCEAARTAIIVFGKRVGTTLTVCTDNHCPIHDPRADARRADNPAPVMAPAPPTETEEEAQQRQYQHKQREKEHEEEQGRRAEEFRLQQEQQQQEYEAQQACRNELRRAREATFKRILADAPPTFTASQLRIVLRAIVNLDPYTFADDFAEGIATENEQRGTVELLLSIIDNTADEQLTSFALRLALSGHVAIPAENQFDFLTEADAVFPPPQSKQKKSKPAKVPTPIKAPKVAVKKTKGRTT